MCAERSPSTGSPLRFPLTPQYEANHLCSWSKAGNITEPINTLQKLDIEVFINLRLRYHVLRTMWWRTNNNSRSYIKGSHAIFAVNSLFNHICNPSVVDGGSITAVPWGSLRWGYWRPFRPRQISQAPSVSAAAVTYEGSLWARHREA